MIFGHFVDLMPPLSTMNTMKVVEYNMEYNSQDGPVRGLEYILSLAR